MARRLLGFAAGLVAKPPGLWVREGWSCSSSPGPGAGIPTQQGTEVSRQPCRVPGRRPKGQGGARAGQPGWNSVMESLWNSLAVPQARQDCNKHLL